MSSYHEAQAASEMTTLRPATPNQMVVPDPFLPHHLYATVPLAVLSTPKNHLAMLPMACFCNRSPPPATPFCNATRRSSKPIPLWLTPTRTWSRSRGETERGVGGGVVTHRLRRAILGVPRGLPPSCSPPSCPLSQARQGHHRSQLQKPILCDTPEQRRKRQQYRVLSPHTTRCKTQDARCKMQDGR